MILEQGRLEGAWPGRRVADRAAVVAGETVRVVAERLSDCQVVFRSSRALPDR